MMNRVHTHGRDTTKTNEPQDSPSPLPAAGVKTGTLEKKNLRRELRRRMEEHGPADSVAVRAGIAKFLEDKPDIRTVAMFAALPGEVDLQPLCAGSDRIWVLPKIVGNQMVFFRILSFKSDLARGAYGIMEPRTNLEEVPPEQIDLFLCPGLGFDPGGGRIGRGKGFYDRMLARARRDALKIGVCFDFQLVAGIEMEAHDIRMNRVISG